jgi:hypothetical protein
MQLKMFMKNLNLQLESSLSSIYKEEKNIISRYQQTTECIFDSVLHLKSFVLNYNFSNTEEEIQFFKEIKPKLLSEYIFNNKVLNILSKRPPGNGETLLNYYEHSLKEITCFFNANQEFYQYCRLNSTYNDAMYFVRQKKGLLHLTDFNMFNFDLGFSSSHDHLVAQIMANDLLETFLKKEIDSISNKTNFPHGDDMGNSQRQELVWTESKSALIELIYALYHTGCLNKGKCDLIELATFFEKGFNVQINNIYRDFQDIKSRNTPIKFIDSLKASLQKKIDEDYQ